MTLMNVRLLESWPTAPRQNDTLDSNGTTSCGCASGPLRRAVWRS